MLKFFFKSNDYYRYFEWKLSKDFFRGSILRYNLGI